MAARDGGSYRRQRDGKLRTLKAPGPMQKYGAHATHPGADATVEVKPTSSVATAPTESVKESGNGE